MFLTPFKSFNHNCKSLDVLESGLTKVKTVNPEFNELKLTNFPVPVCKIILCGITELTMSSSASKFEDNVNNITTQVKKHSQELFITISPFLICYLIDMHIKYFLPLISVIVDAPK
jgi:hypothetical protein